jgi:hypothetical protein
LQFSAALPMLIGTVDDLAQRLQAALGDAYAVERTLGEGGFAVVFLVRDLNLKRKLAVKVLSPDLITSKTVLERFRREAETIAQLSHPNIVPLHFIGEKDGLLYLAMACIEGGSLADRLSREKQLVAGPTDGVAHHIAAEISVMQGDLERALQRLDRADSLGVEFEALDSRLLRMIILARQGRYTEAWRRAVAERVPERLRIDLGTSAFMLEGEAVSWGFNLALMSGDIGLAGELLDARIATLQRLTPVGAMAEAAAIPMLAGEKVPPIWLVELPLGIRMDVLDSVWTRTPAGTGGPRFEPVRSRLAEMVSRAALAPGADPALADRARKSRWFAP